MLGPYQGRTDERKSSSNMAVLSWERQSGVDHLKLTFETKNGHYATISLFLYTTDNGQRHFIIRHVYPNIRNFYNFADITSNTGFNDGLQYLKLVTSNDTNLIRTFQEHILPQTYLLIVLLWNIFQNHPLFVLEIR
jgi:hypothetical protein